MRDKK